MANLAPPHQLILDLISSLEGGEPLREGLVRYSRRSSGPLNLFSARWLRAFDQGHGTLGLESQLSSPYQKILIRIVEEGMRGATVLPRLRELEKEIQFASEDQIERFLQTLPLKVLIPVLLFMFPGFLLLLIGPLVLGFLEAL